jgi:hypothetical protein
VAHRVRRLQRRIDIQIDFNAADVANSRTTNRHLLTAENHITRLTSMTRILTNRVAEILLPAKLHDVVVEQTRGHLHAHFDGESSQRVMHQPAKFVRIRDSKSAYRKQWLRGLRSSLRSGLASTRVPRYRTGRPSRLQRVHSLIKIQLRRFRQLLIVFKSLNCRCLRSFRVRYRHDGFSFSGF